MRGPGHFAARLRKWWRRHPAPPSAVAGLSTERDFRLLAEHSRDIICRIDPDNIPVYVSPAITDVLGWTPEEAILGGVNFIHPDDQSTVMLLNERLFSGEIASGMISYRLLDRSGRPVWVETSARLMRAEDGRPGDVVIVMRDISERKRLEDQLREEALTDSLTGLGNRRAFDQRLAEEWARAARSAEPISLLMIDVDHFKRYNDLYGHPAGDDCLRSLADEVRRAIRCPGDIPARYGGEELGVILPATPAEGALALGEALRRSIEQLRLPSIGGGVGDRVTVSIGAATMRPNAQGGGEPEALVAAADRALYRAKETGRNRVVADRHSSAFQGA